MAFQMPAWNAPRGVSLSYRPMQTPLPQQMDPKMLAAIAALPQMQAATPPTAAPAGPLALSPTAQRYMGPNGQMMIRDPFYKDPNAQFARHFGRGPGRMGGTGGGPGRTGGAY